VTTTSRSGDGSGALLDGLVSTVGLRIASTRPRNGVVVVRVFGDVDLVDATRLADVLGEAVVDAATSGRLHPDERPRVVCDLDGVEFLGAAGLGVLAGAVVTARAHAVELVCFSVRRPVRQVIRLTGLDDALALLPTALEAAPHGDGAVPTVWSA
jgi:anti-sigma B factor antagonist